MVCNQLCHWNDSSDGCIKPIYGICPMSNIASQAKPQTNADRIRAMSDEELADWMAECNAYGENADASQWLPWLKQPAEVSDHDEKA